MSLSLDPSTLFAAPPTSTHAGRPNGTATPSQAKAAKPAASGVQTAPRVDLEPLYTALKAAISEYWAEYKEAAALFVLGKLNLSEFALRTDHFLSGDPHVEHLHNHLIVGLLANVGREAPDAGVAPWVSANDKPLAGVSKTMAGNEAERRLKTEVMALPARERRRLKDISEPEVRNQVPKELMAYQQLRKIQPPPEIPPASAGGLNRTNWDLEIRKRYNQSLAAETGEFPDTEAIQARMLPICYEEALPNGCASQCAHFLATATEYFVKEVLSNFYQRTRLNMANGSVHGTLTHRFKRQYQWEEDAVGNGEVTRVGGQGGLLPVEAREAASRKPLGLADIKLAMETGDSSMGLFSTVRANVYETRLEGEYDEYVDMDKDVLAQLREEEEREQRRKKLVEASDPDVKMNGVTELNGHDEAGATDEANGVLMNGYLIHYGDDDDLGWEGGSKNDRSHLATALDELLNF